MAEKPILFNTEMVRAILERRKTETRRCIRAEEAESVLTSPRHREHPEVPDKEVISKLLEPPCQAGDVLWVRETWAPYEDLQTGEKTVVYRADYNESERTRLRDKNFCWRPSIHMPRTAARIFLRVEDVHPERLQEISKLSIKHEGVEQEAFIVGTDFARGMFSDIWDSTVPKEKKDVYGWKADPWVWVIRFEIMEAPAGF